MARARLPLWWLLALAGGGVALLPAAGTLGDYDVYWRVRMGERMLDTHAVPARELWNFPTAGKRIVPTAWLADLTLGVAHHLGGWPGVVVWRLVAAVALLVLLARLVLPRAGPLAGALTYALAAAAVSPYLQERPQLLSLVLLAALLPRLGPWSPTVPHPVAMAGIGWLWASLHGLWVLAPGLLLLRALTSKELARRALAGAAAAIAGAALTPVGPRLLLQPFVVARAARDLLEWQPITLADREGWVFLALVAVIVAGWARSREPVALAQLAWTGAAVAWGLGAGRNVPVAVLLVAPIAAARLDALLPDRRTTVPVLAFGAVGAICALGVGALAVATPAVPRDAPVRLIGHLNATPREARVLNEYNAGGLVTGFAAPHVHAAIDGRLDPYPPGFLHRYLSALRLQGDWPALLDELRPTHALLDTGSPLAYVLAHDRGWQHEATEGSYILLAAP